MAEVLVEVTRGPIVESVHYGDVAVVDALGRMHYYAGDPYRVAYLRSAAKPLQTLNVLLSGAAEKYAFTDKELAIMCASHYGEDYHQSVILGNLEKIGMTLADLKCAAPLSISGRVAEQQLRDHFPLDTYNSDCSGKHTGFLATCLTCGYPTENYDKIENPLQRAVLAVLAEMFEMAPEEVYIGEDGCGVPVHGVPVFNMALAFAKLAAPDALPPAYQAACQRVFAAMNHHPEMVEGYGGFVTELMEKTHDKLVCKVGAEGVFCIGLKEQGLGIAIKIEDGDTGRSISVAAMQALKALGVLTQKELDALAGWCTKPNMNNHGRQVGEIRPAYQLRRVGAR